MELDKIYNDNCKTGLLTIPDNSIDCCITSPPYFGLRDYGSKDQIGIEESPELFVSNLVSVFEQVKRVLKSDGTLWLNIGDSYWGSGKAGNDNMYKKRHTEFGKLSKEKSRLGGRPTTGKNSTYKSKDLIGIPWMLAFALRANGWYLRQDIIWNKPNPMPESVTDRCTKAHEYIFLLSKSPKYYYDHDAIKTDAINPADDIRRMEAQTWDNKNTPDQLRNGIRPKTKSNFGNRNGEMGNLHSGNPYYAVEKANKRSVWTINTKPFKEAHFATFPQELIMDCIKAGSRQGGVILDPFMGAGTTAVVAKKLNRNYIGYELNPEYIQIAQKRLLKEIGLFL